MRTHEQRAALLDLADFIGSGEHPFNYAELTQCVQANFSLMHGLGSLGYAECGQRMRETLGLTGREYMIMVSWPEGPYGHLNWHTITREMVTAMLRRLANTDELIFRYEDKTQHRREA